MRLQNTIQVKIQGSQGKVTTGNVEHRIWEKKERTLRGIKALGISWGLCLVSVLIPLLHFILVPLFLLAGPFAFFWVTAQEQIILGGKGECPECLLTFDIARSAAKWPISDVCNHCHAPIEIEPMNRF
jgi:hypothetical protein